jgi:hypothetical protein
MIILITQISFARGLTLYLSLSISVSSLGHELLFHAAAATAAIQLN